MTGMWKRKEEKRKEKKRKEKKRKEKKRKKEKEEKRPKGKDSRPEGGTQTNLARDKDPLREVAKIRL